MEFDSLCRICGKRCLSYPCNSCGYNGDGYEQPITKEKPAYEELEAKLQVAVEALEQVSMYSRINHDNPKDYGEIVNSAIEKIKEK
jgi:hypothetical protein